MNILNILHLPPTCSPGSRLRAVKLGHPPHLKMIRNVMKKCYETKQLDQTLQGFPVICLNYWWTSSTYVTKPFKSISQCRKTYEVQLMTRAEDQKWVTKGRDVIPKILVPRGFFFFSLFAMAEHFFDHISVETFRTWAKWSNSPLHTY